MIVTVTGAHVLTISLAYSRQGYWPLPVVLTTLLRIVTCYKVGLNRSPAKPTVATSLYWWPLPSLGLLFRSPFAVFFSGTIAQSHLHLSTPLHQACHTASLDQQLQPFIEATPYDGPSRAAVDG